VANPLLSKNTIYSAAVLTSFSYGFTKLIQFGSNLILTRLLYPEAFGLMALVNTIMLGMAMLSDVGITFSVIQSPKGDEKSFLLTAWTIKVGRGVVLFILACLLAWPVSLLYGEPLLFPLICICSFKALFDGLQSILLLKAQRDMELKRFVLLQIAVQVIAFCLTIGFAVALNSVWALALGSVCVSLIHLFLSHQFFKFDHSFTVDKAALREIVKFGKWLIFATSITFAGGQGLKGIEGYLVGFDVLGFLFMAAMLSGFVTDGYQRIAGQVVFPYLSQLHRTQKQGIQQKFRILRLYIVLPSVLACVAISLFAPYIVNILYDERYQAVGPLLSISAINAAILMQPKMYMDTLLAKGESKAQFYYVSCYTVLAIFGTFVGFYSHGVTGMLVAQGLASACMYIYVLVVTRKTVAIPIALDSLCWALIGAGASLTYKLNFSSTV
jgi:O-antigen/teichoic acid export membrane protein